MTGGRPCKHTVEYFPHLVAHGRIIYVLEEAYGNDGYAFWYKLREILGETPGHFIDCRQLGSWDHIIDKVKVRAGKAESIIDTLSNLEAIDRELWDRCRVVWCQEFVETLGPVYAKRKMEPPERPDELLDSPILDTQKGLFESFGAGNYTEKGFRDTKEVKEVEKSKGSKGETDGDSIPEVLRGLELYENNTKLLKRFPTNYRNWKKAYPHLDIDHQIVKAHCWEIDNPKRQKQSKARFLGGWLSREDDKRAKRPDQSGSTMEDKVRRIKERTQ